MIAAGIIGAVYLIQLGTKAALAARYAKSMRRADRVRAEAAGEVSEGVTIVQPILSGDPKLGDTLAATVRTLETAKFLWLADEDDAEGVAVCERLVSARPDGRVKILRCEPHGQGENPKAHKLALALPLIETAVFVVLDDDTRLTAGGLEALKTGLAGGAALATGLPRYHAAEGTWSGWLAEFVNSAAVLTYLPVLAFAEPVSIHGMCYAMRTDEARRLDVFHTIRPALTDDLALALELRKHGLRIVQTVEPHDIATSVPTVWRLTDVLHRWFVFTRLLLEECPWKMRVGIAVAYAVPPLLLIGLVVCVCAAQSAGAAGVLVGTLVVRDLALRVVKQRFLGGTVEHRAVASAVLEIAQPVLLVWSWMRKTIRWRTRMIRVRSVSDFEYV